MSHASRYGFLASRRTRLAVASLCCLTLVGSPTVGFADDEAEAQETEQAKPSPVAAEAGDKDDKGSSDEKPAPPKPKYPPASKVLKDTKPIDGLLKMHLSDTKLFAELKSSDLDKDFIILITIAKGIGKVPLLGGFSWNDDWVWQFRKRGDNIQVVRRNVRFKAKPGTPTAEAVKLAYTDSVLFSLPIATRSGGAYVIDLTPVFFTDLPQISQVLTGFSFSKQRSTWGPVKGYDKNMEIQVAATYASSGYSYLETVPDSRAATINVHYSISKLPKTDYRPREADDRIGYFLSAVKDFSKKDADDRFRRYITRWNLQKEDPSADVSNPKEPIKFWLEKTVPFKYRKPIRDGIEEWNKAFEKAGFYNAINVEQQPKDADWDPGDINYNTFRWITSGAGFAMGPSRVNPTTGEILDADIIFDADFLQYWKTQYEYFTPQGIEAFTGGPIEMETYAAQQRTLPRHLRNGHNGRCSCNLLGGASQQLAYAAAVAASRKQSPEDLEELIMQGLKEVTMHEVGHTLGLRHNFKASTLYSLDDLKDPEKTAKTGLTASVMDYAPVYMVPEDEKQGLYYSQTIGPYDYWAIEYGYKPLKDEKKDLGKIASRSGEHGLAFSTDEETRGIDPDPHSRRWDMGDDLVAYAEQQAKVVAESLPRVVDDLVEEGEGYQKARQAFGILLRTHTAAVFAASRYVGGVYVSRAHKGDDNAPEPFEVVDVEQQRAALDLVANEVFSDKPFSIPPELYNKLAPSRWRHWGTEYVYRSDYEVHDVILRLQDRLLSQLLGSLTMSRLHDNELKIPAEEEALTVADLIETLTDTIFSEITEFDSDAEGEYTNRKPLVSSLRRNLQRSYLGRLADLALGRTSAPADCQTLAYDELANLKVSIDELLEDEPDLDRYSAAHLREASDRIRKVLETDRLFEGGGGASLLDFLLFGKETDAASAEAARRLQAPVLADPTGGGMKLIIAVIQPTKLEATQEALAAIGVTRMTVADAMGFARQRGHAETYRGHEYETHLLRKVELEIAVNDDFVEPVLRCLEEHARTSKEGHIGDGKARIRSATGSRGRARFSMTALLITADLMAGSMAEGAAQRAGVSMKIVAPGRASDERDARFVAIDLTAPIADLSELVAQLRASSPEATLLAYGPHVHEAKLQAAQDAGCDLVVSRGQFHKQVEELLRRHASAEG
ncbi:unnamed protein product [Cladocopium goreaui]|uniref:Nitrogen regulatory protein P-II n=1 Tax=Cladocopium goreaui TaxID=2562237 RepID=A0A9P1G1Q0_9DINO|nr:unnamed protein product [Cladocopium goreaui]